MDFLNGFRDEIEKTAKKINPRTKAWALSRGITSGAAAALMGLALLTATGKSKTKKEKREAMIRSTLIPGAAGTAVGLGKGFAEKGLERKFLKMLARGK